MVSDGQQIRGHSSERSEDSFGFTIAYARRMAFNRGYDTLLLPDGKDIPLDEKYLSKTGSL